MYLVLKLNFAHVSDNGCTTIKRSLKVFGKVIGLIGKWVDESVENFIR